MYQFTTFQRKDGGADSSERMAKAYGLGEPAPGFFDTSGMQEVPPSTAFETQYRKIAWPEEKIQQHIAELKYDDELYARQ